MMDFYETSHRDEHITSADAHRLRIKALAEFVADSEEERIEISRTIWDRVQAAMKAWARHSGYERHHVRFGWCTKTQWFPPPGDPTKPPIDSVELYLSYLLPEAGPSLEQLIKRLSVDAVLSHRMILASLLLHELEANNKPGASIAAEALDATSGHVRNLAEGQHKRTEKLREYGRRGAKTIADAANERTAEILAEYKKLIDGDKKSREIASIIARKLRISAKTVRQHLHKALHNKK